MALPTLRLPVAATSKLQKWLSPHNLATSVVWLELGVIDQGRFSEDPFKAAVLLGSHGGCARPGLGTPAVQGESSSSFWTKTISGDAPADGGQSRAVGWRLGPQGTGA